MKIAIDISQIAYPGSGVARYVEKLVQSLANLDKSNQYLLFGSSLRMKFLLKDFSNNIYKINNHFNNKIYPFPQTLVEIIWNKLHIFPFENLTGKVDIIHTSDWVEPPSRAPKITTVHDFLVFKYPNLFPQDLVETQKRRISWVIEESKYIIVDSHSTKSDGVNLLSIPSSKLIVIYPGVSQIFVKKNRQDSQKILNKYKIKQPYLLCVGTREPRKNLDKTIEAFKIINRDYDISLVIVGKLGWGIDRKPNDERIIFLGYVPDTDLPYLYSETDCFVYPSLYEGFGFPVLEALSCGAKVVTSKEGSLKEVGGKFTIYVDPESLSSIVDGIEKALKSKQESEKAMLWAKSFTWEKTAREVLEVYKKAAF